MPKKRNPKRMPSLDIVTADFNAGMTNDAMSEKYDVAVSAVSAYLSRHGFSRRKKVFIPPDDVLVDCLRHGLNCKQIAEKHGGHPDGISRYIRQNRLRDGIAVAEVPPAQPALELCANATKVINAYGISVPRIPTIHGRFEVRP